MPTVDLSVSTDLIKTRLTAFFSMNCQTYDLTELLIFNYN